jgi:formylglycine-generating enzyme required for sulfatase activity
MSSTRVWMRLMLVLAPALGVGLCALGLISGVSASTSTAAMPEDHSDVISSEEVYVPAGQFYMGCAVDLSNVHCDGDAQPIHPVYLDAFFIDRTEVTNAQYRACENAGACLPPLAEDSETRSNYYTNPAYDDYPVIHINWARAWTYCDWVGRRLPTEAEWEKAARGTDMRWYPWGNTSPTCDLLNYTWVTFVNGEPRYHRCVGDTAPVGSCPDGASPYGALDMAGNVREWVNDFYYNRYYHTSPYYNPPGPASTPAMEHLVRGGAWADHRDFGTNTWVRMDEASIYDTWLIGFRCARDATGPAPTPTVPPTPTPTPTPFDVRAIEPSGGMLWIAYGDRLTLVSVPSGTVGSQTVFTLTYDGRPDVQGDYQGIDQFFAIEASPAASGSLSLPLELTLGHNDQPGIVSGTAYLYRWMAGAWVTSGITVVEQTDYYLVAQLENAGTYGMLGRTNRLYLPFTLRDP